MTSSQPVAHSPQGDPAPRELGVHETAIPGLFIVDLTVHRDARGWFKENWQRAKMTALGLPDFVPVQHSVAWNARRGVTRGFHAEPWDKFVSLTSGRVHGAWVDLREGPHFGTTVTLEFGTDQAVYVPRGVGNAYQTLVDDTSYSYLVTDHWSPHALGSYCYLNLADETVAIEWPIPLDESTRSEADLKHPRLADVVPMPSRRVVVLGSDGQLGRALMRALPEAAGLDREHLDLTDPQALETVDWTGVGVVINAAAFTGVDAAETEQGRRDAWATNVTALARLTTIAADRGLTVVHVSSDYVFDGSRTEHDEDEPFSPLGVYGQTKAAGDALVATVPRHYVVRTSWVVGDGRNFVATMCDLAHRGASPRVVDDQHGRLTFADDLAAGIVHLVSSGAPFGTYNLSNSGEVQTWADIASEVFALCGRDPGDIVRIDTATWTTEARESGRCVAARPRHSTLVLDRLEASGHTPPPARESLIRWVEAWHAQHPPARDTDEHLPHDH